MAPGRTFPLQRELQVGLHITPVSSIGVWLEMCWRMWLLHQMQAMAGYDGKAGGAFVGYSHNDFAADETRCKSVSGPVFLLCGGAVVWFS